MQPYVMENRALISENIINIASFLTFNYEEIYIDVMTWGKIRWRDFSKKNFLFIMWIKFSQSLIFFFISNEKGNL